MNDIINLSNVYLNYLTPLLKWRVMDLESLRKECASAPTYKSFHRIIRSLEKKNVLEGYRDPYSRKKFVYLSSFGERHLSLKENPTALSKSTLIHDIKVSEIARTLLDESWVDEIELEHQIQDKRSFKVNYKVIPDAILHFEKSGHRYRLALELELTRKNNQRLVEKIRQYLSTGYYHYVIYIFPTVALMNKYVEVISDKVGEEAISRIMFFCHENLSHDAGDLNAINGSFKGKEISFAKLFNDG